MGAAKNRHSKFILASPLWRIRQIVVGIRKTDCDRSAAIDSSIEGSFLRRKLDLGFDEKLTTGRFIAVNPPPALELPFGPTDAKKSRRGVMPQQSRKNAARRRKLAASNKSTEQKPIRDKRSAHPFMIE